MTMKHVLVSELHGKPGSNDPRNDPHCAEWPFMLDGIPVRREVHELATELRRSYHGFRFHASYMSNIRPNRLMSVINPDNKTFRFYSDVTVYIEGSDYVVGVIGHGKRYGIKEVDKPVYMIQSRKIENEKFASHRDQYNMSFMADHKKAVRTALSKLVPYSPKEMASTSIGTFRTYVESVRSALHRNVADLLSPLSDRNVMMREMRSLIAQNTMFVTEQFQRAAAEFIKAEAEWEKVKSKPIHGYYVYVRMVGNEQWVDIVDATDMQTYIRVEDCRVTSMPVSDVPEDIQGKVAVLSIATIDQYMNGLGMRVSEKSFWLER